MPLGSTVSVPTQREPFPVAVFHSEGEELPFDSREFDNRKDCVYRSASSVVDEAWFGFQPTDYESGDIRAIRRNMGEICTINNFILGFDVDHMNPIMLY